MAADAPYRILLEVRTALRRFERWSAEQARAAGLTPAQHQLLLAVRGHADPAGPTIGDVAEYLLLRHHSVVGLVDRAEAAGLITRRREATDQRVVRLRLTKDAERRLRKLSRAHAEELRRLAGLVAELEAADPDSR
jgi:DNA-binding MarR family transcriptional regulator